MLVSAEFRHPLAENKGIYSYGMGVDGKPHAILPRSLVKGADMKTGTLMLEIETLSTEGDFLMIGYAHGTVWIPNEEILALRLFSPRGA